MRRLIRRKILAKHNTSGYIGVCFDKQNNKWRATMTYCGRKVLDERFNTPEEASLAYQNERKKYFTEDELRVPTYREARDKQNKKQRERWWELKLRIFKEYGNKCVCCGENNPELLTIDHIDGKGKEHRKQLSSRSSIYIWIRQNNFPKDNFRILCWNCNCSRGQYGYCPHEMTREEHLKRKDLNNLKK